MQLTINGKKREVAGRTVAEVARALGYEGEYFAVALNMSCVPRARHAETPVKDGDAIEILTPMQGG